MACAEGTVIECHSKDEFDAYMAKAYKTGKLVVIFFTDPACGPCIAIAPVVAERAKEYPTEAVFLKVETTEPEMEEVASSYCVEGTPTFVFIRGGVTWESFAGAFPDKLRNTVKEFIDNPVAAASAFLSA